MAADALFQSYLKEISSMKKLMVLALGLSFVLGTVTAFAQDTPPKKSSKKKSGKKAPKKAPKKDGAVV
jgi:hypothetical protein